MHIGLQGLFRLLSGADHNVDLGVRIDRHARQRVGLNDGILRLVAVVLKSDITHLKPCGLNFGSCRLDIFVNHIRNRDLFIFRSGADQNLDGAALRRRGVALWLRACDIAGCDFIIWHFNDRGFEPCVLQRLLCIRLEVIGYVRHVDGFRTAVNHQQDLSIFLDRHASRRRLIQNNSRLLRGILPRFHREFERIFFVVLDVCI